MDFASTGGSDHVDKTACRGAAYDGVIHHHDALAVENFAHRVVFDSHFGVATGLRRLNESATDVVVANKRQLEWQPRLLGESKRGGVGRVGHAEYQVGIGGGEVTRKTSSQLTAGAIDGAAEHVTVRSGEIDEFKDALAGLFLLERRNGAHTIAVDGDDLAALYLSLHRRAKQIQRATFRSEDDRVTQAAHHQGPPAPRIARSEQSPADDDDQTVSALDSLQRVCQSLFRFFGRRARHSMYQHLGIHGRTEDGAGIFEFPP